MSMIVCMCVRIQKIHRLGKQKLKLITWHKQAVGGSLQNKSAVKSVLKEETFSFFTFNINVASKNKT